MANITENSLAAAVTAQVKNVVLQPAAQVLPRKVLLIGTGLAATEAGNPIDELVFVTSAEDVGARVGYGSMLHRLAVGAFAGSRGIETWMIQQAEAAGAASASAEISVASVSALAGTIHLYIAGDYVPIPVTKNQSANDIASAILAAVGADPSLPVSAAVLADVVTLTAKSAGTYGNDISIAFNLGFGQELPSGVTITAEAMTGGSGIPDVQTALDALGTGDGSNEDFFTDVCVAGYGTDSTTLDKISAYVGAGNDFIGLYDKAVHKPFRCLFGDTAPDTAGLTALIAIGDGRKDDRASGIIAVPGSQSHPAEIAAQALGVMARVNNNRAEENYVDQILSGVWPGAKSDRWTSEYNDRDTAVKAGISPAVVKSGGVYMSNLVTFYHPDSVPQTSNGYRSMRNISILQNILLNTFLNFEQEKWKGTTIVSDVQRVTNVTSRKKARDVETVKDDLVALAQSYEANAWIYSSSFTIDALKEPGSVVVRTGGDGFISTMKVVLSGEGNIFDTTVEFDTSIAVFL